MKRNFFTLLITCSILLLPMPGQAKTHFADLTTKRYKQAAAFYHTLSFHKGEQNRKRWLQCIKKFQRVYHSDTKNKVAPHSLYMLAKIYGEMFARFHNEMDLDESIGYYEDLAYFYPYNSLADDALLKLGILAAEHKHDKKRAEALFARLITVYPSGDMADDAAQQLRKLKGVATPAKQDKPHLVPEKNPPPMVHLNQPIRFWSNKNYTRIVIETSKPISYKEAFLKAEGNLPRRLYVDLFNCRISPTFQNAIPIRDGLLKRVRGAQFNKNTVRVVLDTESVQNYKIFSLSNPFRVVIDVTAQKKQQPRSISNLPTLAEQFGLGVRTIVIDPGHGGKDPGAIGFSGLQEKDIVLKVAKKVADILKKESPYTVILTRDRDVFIPLEERTAIANTKEADLFVSIHANSAPNKKAKGIETYYLSLATTREEMRAAARENAASAKQLSDLQTILQDLMKNSKIEESAKLADSVQQLMVDGLNKNYQVNNLGVKKAPFIVLIGAQMPAILTEIAFISNKDEEKRLRNDNYQYALARQIVAGVKHYVKNLNGGI